MITYTVVLNVSLCCQASTVPYVFHILCIKRISICGVYMYMYVQMHMYVYIYVWERKHTSTFYDIGVG